MFGHDDNNNQQTDDVPATVQPDQMQEPQEELTLPAPSLGTDQTNVTATDDMSALSYDPNVDQSSPEPEHLVHTDSATSVMSAPPTPTQSVAVSNVGTLSNLTELKMDALRELSPLIGQLNQTPSEKYETAKMIYEETKDQSVLNAVYEAAKNLTDDKAKAEAILDIVKKINAF